MQVLANRYQIQKQLGKKAGRQTLLAQDLQTESLVVVKILTFDPDFEWDDLKLFEREAATLKSLSHPAIPQYLDYFELNESDRKGFALVQTYIDARSLEDHLKAGRSFSESEVKELAKSLLEILGYLHDRQPPVIHRDLKPSNILLSDRSGNSPGQVYLVDFGSVQTLAAKEGGTITVVGTYGYMPPEQFGGRATPASDLYSLGATLIYLAVGQHPAELPQDDLRIEFEMFAGHLSDDLRSWLRQLTEPSKRDRFESVAQATEALMNPELLMPTQRPIKLSIRTQPADSRMRLTKSTSSFDVIIPSKGFSLMKVLLAIGLDSILILGLILLIADGVGVLVLALTSPLWLVGLALTYRVIRDLFGRLRLRIDEKTVSFATEMFGLKLNRLIPTPRSKIRRLVYIPRHSARDTRGKVVFIPPQITIWFHGFQGYELNSIDLGLQDSEMEWLAYELSQWLKLPLDRT